MREPSIRIGLVILLFGLFGVLPCSAWAERGIADPTRDAVDFLSAADLIAHAQSARHSRFEFAAQQVEAPARALVRSAAGKEALDALELAAELSPGLPLAQFALAAELGRSGEFREAMAAAGRGVRAVPQHVEARLWWTGSAMLLLALVTITSALGFVFTVGSGFFRQAAHDLGDLFSRRMPGFARAALLLACLLGPLSLGEGILGLALGGFAIGAVYGQSGHRSMLLLAVALLILGLFPLTERAGRALQALDADPVASSALAVVRGRATPAQLATLHEAAASGGDALALRSLAVEAGRAGDVETARALFGELLQRQEGDVMALTVLGNMAFRSGDLEQAIGYYERARRQGASFELSYGLAQAYAKDFRIEDFDHAMVEAQKLDPERATELSQLGDPDLVVDPAFPMNVIRARMLKSADGAPWVQSVAAVVAPGWLGREVGHMLAAFGLIWLMSLLVRSRYQHAGHCERCGCTICARCDGGMWNRDICDSCHFLFSRPQAADPALRTLRIKALGIREKRAKRLSTLSSLLLPGIAGMLARRPDLAFVSIFCFVGTVVFWTFRRGPVPEPLAVGEAAWVIFGLVSGLLLTVYVFSLMASLAIRRSQ